MVHFTQYVGVAPDTTTIQITPLAGALGVCPPGFYPSGTSTEIAPSGGAPMTLNPYATEAALTGPRGLRGARWDLGLLGFAVAFVGVIGYAVWKR